MKWKLPDTSADTSAGGPIKPKRRVTLDITLGADSWEEAAEALTAIASRIVSDGPIDSFTSGGWASGYHVAGNEDSDQTGDKYRQQNKAYVDWLSKRHR